MRTLVIDTATQLLSLALFDDAQCLTFHHECVQRGHAERLIPAIAAFPDGGRADRIAVDVGPGSFTGVRIGIAAARALSFAWGIPVTGYSALSLVAAIAVRDSAPTEDFPVAVSGGHGELFWQMFAAQTGRPMGAITSTPIATLAAHIRNDIVYGSGSAALVTARGSGTAIDIESDSRAFVLLDTADASLPSSPIYGREADAKPMAVREGA